METHVVETDERGVYKREEFTASGGVTGRKEGLYCSYYRNGNLWELATYSDGCLWGPYTLYYECGQKAREGEYRWEEFHGTWSSWDDDGSLVEVLEYDEGKLIRVVSCVDNEDRETVLPEGEITVWKAGVVEADGGTDVYIRLRVPADAKRVTPMNVGIKRYLSRVSMGVVDRIEDVDGTEYPTAKGDDGVVYTVGATVRAPDFDADPSVTDPVAGSGRGIWVHRFQDQCEVSFHGTPVERPVSWDEEPIGADWCVVS